MSERSFRLILGLLVLVFAYWENEIAYFIAATYLLFEGLSDWRLTRFTTHWNTPQNLDSKNAISRINFDAERALRIIVAGLLLTSYFLYQWLWFIPWIVGSFLVLSGVVNFCPMVVFLRHSGMR